MAFNYFQPMAYQTGYNPLPVGGNLSPTASNSNTGMVWVDGYNEATMYPVVPNGAVQLWDKNAPVVYLKKADATGRPSMQIYDLVERKEAPKEREVKYATQEEVARLSEALDELRKKFEGINKDNE